LRVFLESRLGDLFASRHFGAMLGDRLNIYPVKGYSITVGMDDVGTQSAAT
jgi:D-amino-acid dehydrogenase